MTTRGKWQGMLTIARFNWPFYLAAAVVLISSVFCLVFMPGAGWKIAATLALLGSLYFFAGSLGVSHLIYDRSDLYRWKWLDRALAGPPPRHIIFCHSGFDESSASLRGRIASAEWTLLDHFDPVRMTEASIRRARALFPPVPGTLPSPSDNWPVASRTADVIFGMLAIHELRRIEERADWFTEANRCLKNGGRVIIVEHARDPANFLAFGPGFLHFHSPRSWRESWEKAGLRKSDEFRITPWIRVFILIAHD